MCLTKRKQSLPKSKDYDKIQLLIKKDFPYLMFANKRRLLISILITAVILATGIAIAWYTPVSIPDEFAGQIAIYTRNKPNAEVTVAVIKDGAKIQQKTGLCKQKGA